MAQEILTTQVMPEWVDYNGHMNDAEYARVFSMAVDEFSDAIGLDAEGRKSYQVTLFTLETHLCYLAEAHESEALAVGIDVLDRDTKRVHAFFSLYNAQGRLIATSEQMLMAMGVASGRPAVLPDSVSAAVDDFGCVEPDQWPEQAGRTIGIRRH